MQYIVHKRFKAEAICGPVNLPAKTECEETNGFICYNGKPLCRSASENGHQYFARNDDGNGMLRGKLTQTIQKALKRQGESDDKYQARWDKVWDDPQCQAYKRTEYADYWLWNDDFFKADILTLQHIAALVGAKV